MAAPGNGGLIPSSISYKENYVVHYYRPICINHLSSTMPPLQQSSCESDVSAKNINISGIYTGRNILQNNKNILLSRAASSQ